jgi:hypothetical protein
MKIDGISAIAVILIGSFAIDRIVYGLTFALGFLPVWSKRFPDPDTRAGEDRRNAERRQKLTYFCFSALLAILLCFYGNLRIFRASGVQDMPGWLDALVTGLVLIGGADRVAGFLNVGGGEHKPAPQPIQITGKITVDQSASQIKSSDVSPATSVTEG